MSKAFAALVFVAAVIAVLCVATTSSSGVAIANTPPPGTAACNCRVAASASPTASPTPTPTPTPSPTPTPTSLPAYVYSGTGNQIYGTPGVGDPQANVDVSLLSPDPSSSPILARQGPNNVFTASSESNNYRPNVVATPTAPAVTVTATPGGHQPPITFNSANGLGGAGATVNWDYANFFLQNGCQANCNSDNHWMVIDPGKNLMWQGSGGNTDGSSFFASYDGFIDSTNESYCAQIGDKGDNFTVSGLPGWGFILMGDDLLAAVNSGTPINHPTGIVVAVQSVAVGTGGVNLSPIKTNSVGTCTSDCLQFGDWLRLKASYDCSTAGGGDVRTVAVCNSWKVHGLIVVDLGSIPTPHTGRDVNQGDQTTAALYNWWHGLSMATDMELIKRGSVHC